LINDYAMSSAFDMISSHPCIISHEECQALISLSETIGFTYTPVVGALDGPRGFTIQNGRDNDRAAIEDFNLADALWRRVLHAIPRKIEGKTVVGLNERLRFYRYTPGQSFSPHTDGYFLRANGERSLLTLILYLNDDYTGGETRFFQPEKLIVPRRGQALLFSHGLWHEGLPVTSGCKYVLRTDVIYKAEANPF
jgi:prolyl 4-hydroxylase